MSDPTLEQSKPLTSTVVKILIVDDHGLVREGLQAILSRSDLSAQCIQAWDAASLWSQLGDHLDIELILLDIQLPSVNGLSLLQSINQHHPHVPVIMLSADEDANIVRRSIEQGAHGFLPKSSLNQVLVSAIRLVAAGGVYVPPQVLQAPPSLPPATTELGGQDITVRQAEVLELLLQGMSNKQIGRTLDLAEPTVKIHVRGILRALGLNTRAEVIAKYASHKQPDIAGRSASVGT